MGYLKSALINIRISMWREGKIIEKELEFFGLRNYGSLEMIKSFIDQSCSANLSTYNDPPWWHGGCTKICRRSVKPGASRSPLRSTWQTSAWVTMWI